MTKTEEYRRYIKLNEHFIYKDDVINKIKEHNPVFTKVATSDTWDKVFGRTTKKDVKPFFLQVAQNQPRWVYDISQTIGKPLPIIYQNVSGKVNHYQSILNCLMSFSVQPVMFQDGASYYTGIGQDSFVQNGKIIIRPALSEQQVIFTLVREIVRHNQTLPVIVEIASYIICRYLNIKTSAFTYGLLLELLDFDVSFKILKDKEIQNTIIKEAEILIVYINSHLPFLYESILVDNDVSLEEEHETVAEQTNPKIVEKNNNTTQLKTESVNDIDLRFINIIREFTNTLPDKSINIKAVRDYGYFDTNMMPISHKVALQLFLKGREIYKLHNDNTEERLELVEEINKHHGFFGISHNEWSAMQVQMVKDGVDSAKVRINRWDSIVNGEVKKEGGNKHINQNIKPQNQTDEPKFNSDGSIIITEDDICYEKIENETWLETALPLFFEQTGYKQNNIPFFANKKDYTITSEMMKINSLMGYYCAYCITTALDNYKNKSVETGKTTYNIKKAVSFVCTHYNVKHISYAIDKHWPEIKVPKLIKKSFDNYFERIRKNLCSQPKKPTLDEQLHRLKAADKTNGAESEGNSQDKTNERNAEIYHIINTYKKYITENKNKPQEVLSIMPPMLNNT